MQRYDISGGFGMDQSFHPCDDGAYVFYSDAMEEIEDWKRAWRIQSDTVKLAEAEIEKKDKEIERLKTVPMKYRRMEFNAKLQKENEDLHKEIAKLKDELECYKLSPDEKTKLISSWQKRSFEFEDELSRLTTALKDDERAEKVAQVEITDDATIGEILVTRKYIRHRKKAINDYRAEILKEVGI